ncbi:MAG: hypothetical protein GEU99_19995 [Luteitalea sp.]|nr:hypothetical protein [Luteitalea sp.]
MFARCVMVVVCWLFGVTAASAQVSAGGSLRGKVLDEQGAVLAGVTVMLIGSDSSGISETRTDIRGIYLLPDVPAGTYVLKATLKGFATLERPGITIRAGRNLTLDLTLRLGSLEETVVVHQDLPLLESSTAVQAVNISGDLQSQLPLAQNRRWSEALTLVPGSVVLPSSIRQRTDLFIHGSDPHTHVAQLDGATINPMTGATGPWHSNLNPDLIQDIQVKTAATDASAPLGLGAIINIASRSGTNQWHGAATLNMQPRRWNDANGPGESASLRQTLGDLSAGGPVLRDTAWWFAAYRRQQSYVALARTPEELEIARALIPNFTPYDLGISAEMFFLKPTVQLSPHQLLLVQAEHDISRHDGGTNRQEVPSESSFAGPAANVRLTSTWNSRFMTRVGVSWNRKHVNNEPSSVTDRPRQWVWREVFPSGGRLIGTGFLAGRGAAGDVWTESGDRRLGITANAVYHRPFLIGTHELQFGASWEPIGRGRNFLHYVNDGRSSENAVLTDPSDLSSPTIVFNRTIQLTPTVQSSDRNATDLGLYIQDMWRPVERLSTTLGLRADWIRQNDRLCEATESPAEQCIVQDTVAIGPRLGINYLLTGDGRTRLAASWGRVHESALRTGISIAATSPAERDEYDLDLDGRFETVFESPGGTSLVPNRRVDPFYDQSRADEWTLTLSRQLGANTVLTASATRRNYRDRPTFQDVNAIYEDGMFQGYQDERLNQIYMLTNNRGNWPVYTDAKLIVTHQGPALQLIASYTRQWRHIAGTWQPDDPATFIQPEAFPNDRGIGATGGTIAPGDPSLNSLSGSAMNEGAHRWQDHLVHAALAWSAPWELLVGLSYTWQSGYWSGPVVTRVDAPDPRFGPPTLQLANGRVVPNPLATTIRFAYPTRGEGQLRAPAYAFVNLRLGRAFRIRNVRLEASLDFFNVANSGDALFLVAGANQLYNPDFGRTADRQPPRSAQATIRVTF